MNGTNGMYPTYADGRVPLGTVVSGSLSEGVKVRLNDGVSIDVPLGFANKDVKGCFRKFPTDDFFDEGFLVRR